MTTDVDRIALAQQLYERSVFYGEKAALGEADRVLDAVEADLALARGRVVHARYLGDRLEDPTELGLFERAARLYHELGDARREGEALFWAGTFHQVVRDDHAAALPLFERAQELATKAGDELTLSYVVRHLGFVEQNAGRIDAARALLEESVRLRRSVGFWPGVAANLLGLAYMARDSGDRAEALRLLAEATTVATDCGATGILGWIEQSRAELQA